MTIVGRQDEELTLIWCFDFLRRFTYLCKLFSIWLFIPPAAPPPLLLLTVLRVNVFGIEKLWN